MANESADQSSRDERYARHFSLAQVGRPGQEKINAARVLVVGAGGLGSPAALYLAAAGVGCLTIVDDDRVSLSNLQRQILFDSDDVGAPKAERAGTRLGRLNPDIEIVTHDFRLDAGRARGLVRDHDIVVDGSDNFATRYLVNDACVLEGKPLVFGALYKFEAQLSLLHAVGGPCYRCLYPTPPTAESIPNCAETGVLGVLPGVTGTLMATEVLKLILNLGQSLSGVLLTYDALGAQFYRRAFVRNPACAVCGDQPTILDVASGRRVQGLTWSEVSERSAEFRWIDVRTFEEYAEGSAPQALHIPLAQLAQRAPELLGSADSRPILLICKSGQRSSRGVEILNAAGIHTVQHLEGGLRGTADDLVP